MKYLFKEYEDVIWWAGNSDIYVLGSGATISHIDPNFFIGKEVIATNGIAERLGLYNMPISLTTHTHYIYGEALELAAKYPNHAFFCPERDQGFGDKAPEDAPENIVFYPHKNADYDFNVDTMWPDNDDGLLVGSTSLHGSMHLAAYMGASTIILVGADCGTLDGETNDKGYKSGNLVTSDSKQWLERWEMHLREVKRKIKEVYYPVEIYSLNPFVNPNMEGHVWEGSRKKI